MATRLEFCLGQLLPPFPGGLWKAIQHHGGIQRLLVLLAGVPVCSVLCLGPLVNLCEQLNCAGPRLPRDTLLQGKKPMVSFIVNNCSDIFIPHNPHPPTWYALRMTVCLSYFSFPDGLTFILSLYLHISHSEINKLCLPSTLVEVTHWKSNVLLFVLGRHIEARMLGKKSDAQIRDLGRVKAEVEGLEYLFLPPALTLWAMESWAGLPGQIYHYALPSVPSEMYKSP